VTGCALLLQAFRLRATLPPYTPLQLRALLSDPAINTSSANPGDLIGVMPNLRAIIEQQQLAPLPPFEIGATS
jgi:hypothetical protein